MFNNKPYSNYNYNKMGFNNQEISWLTSLIFDGLLLVSYKPFIEVKI